MRQSSCMKTKAPPWEGAALNNHCETALASGGRLGGDDRDMQFL